MLENTFSEPRSRYNIVLLYTAINLAAFTVLRLLLFIRSFGNIDHSFWNVAYVFGCGFFYDVIFNIYFSLFFVILLLNIPNKIYNSRFFKFITYFFFFLFLYALYFILAAEWMFWGEFSARFNFVAVDYLIYRREVTQNIYESYPLLWILFGIFIASSATFYMLRSPLSKILSVKEKFSNRFFITAIIIGLSFLSYFGVGQSFRALSDNNYENELASNGPYQFVAAFRDNVLNYREFYAVSPDDKKLSDMLKLDVGKNSTDGKLYDIVRDIKANGEERKLNVILISVESLSARFLSRFGEKENITPFMDKWFKEGLLFTNFYATGTRTTRGLEAITLSIPPTPGRSLVKRPDNAKMDSLGKIFKDHGYDVAFLYGGRGFFDNMNAFFSHNGYRIIDETSFKDDEVTFKNAWGVADGDLYRKAVQEANKTYASGRPFFFHIMTVSNHRPYTYPKGKIDIPSGTGRFGAVKYTDQAMLDFISLSKKQKWFNDTVFVIVADHCAGSAGKVGLPIDKYHIPLFIYAPRYIRPAEVAKVSSQIDIAPTLLSLLHFSYKSCFFGEDILNDKFTERALIGNYQKLAEYKDNKLVILSPERKIEIINHPSKNDDIRKTTMSDFLVLDTMAYYQGADFILKNKMNRWN